MSKVKSIVILVVTTILVALLSVLCFASFELPKFIKNGTRDYNSIGSKIGMGIDIRGGYYAVLTPSMEDGSAANDETFDRAISVIQKRLDNKGYTEATVTPQGSGATREIRVEVPEVDDDEEMLNIIGSSGKLSFRDDAGTEYLTGDHVKRSYASYDKDGNPIVVLEFTPEGTSRFAVATAGLVGDLLYIYLGDELVSSPRVNETINSSTAEITGLGSMEEAESDAAIINAGTLPIKFEVGELNKISASLGENALTASLIAGAIGLLVIFVLMIVKYRGLGIAASIGLIVYTLLLIVLLALIPIVQLTLPGIAGIILSIGMAVDANVIIFERINEEYSVGKTVLSSVKAGFKRAIVTVLDSNVTTVLAAVVLYILCPGSIKGFAVTLFIGIVLSMLTSIFVSRFYINVLGALTQNKQKLFGLKREEVEDDED